ncbi:hypothetical protein FB390_2242 [Nocardia bhagyanarayanae]|uniref:Uncharacterized protein n=2 Tax=Nocardia bhagyanarayanae TaxID=1215925 RepID=A0A543F9U8_9NOCA|nr:hypothetical protein FB390_2242 [Nocardia bhagyanarayanae]
MVALIAGIAAMHVGIFTTPAVATHHSTAAADRAPAVASAAAQPGVSSPAHQVAAIVAHQAAAVAGDPASPIATQVADIPPTPDHATDGGLAPHNASAATNAINQAMSSGSATTTEQAARISDHRPGSADRADHTVAHRESSAGTSARPGCAECGDGHAGPHACVFILTALAMAVLLVVLYRIAGDHLEAGPKPRHRRPRRERPPPWTVLSLAELSILRI